MLKGQELEGVWPMLHAAVLCHPAWEQDEGLVWGARGDITTFCTRGLQLLQWVGMQQLIDVKCQLCSADRVQKVSQGRNLAIHGCS